MVATPTTSLPEKLGGSRNWDYRFCWLRDAAFTLLAFLNAGYTEEADAWQQWLLRAVAGGPEQLHIMYGVAGERELREWELDWLSGYEGSRPVRVGNAASHQTQLDVYGEFADVLEHAERGGLSMTPRRQELRVAFLDHLEKIWSLPDAGIWEFRGAPQHFVHSKVMAWVAFDRAWRSPEAANNQRQRDRWKRLAGNQTVLAFPGIALPEMDTNDDDDVGYSRVFVRLVRFVRKLVSSTVAVGLASISNDESGLIFAADSVAAQHDPQSGELFLNIAWGMSGDGTWIHRIGYQAVCVMGTDGRSPVAIS